MAETEANILEEAIIKMQKMVAKKFGLLEDVEKTNSEESSEMEDDITINETSDIKSSKRKRTEEKCLIRDNIVLNNFNITNELDNDQSDYNSDGSDELVCVYKASDSKIKSSVELKYTDDGFKVMSNIPEDDSDISDAFFSGDEDCDEDFEVPISKPISLNKKIPKTTEIVSRSEKIKIKMMKLESIPDVDQKPNVSSNQTKPNVSSNQTKSAKKRLKKKQKKLSDRIPFTEDEQAAFKASFPKGVQKMVDDFGMDWLDLEKLCDREKRELARLPQPEQIPNCRKYFRRCPTSGKILTVFDYSAKGKTFQTVGNTPTTMAKQKIVEKKTESQTEEERLEARKKQKEEHLEELRAIKRDVFGKLDKKTLSREQQRAKKLKLIEKLGGTKVKNKNMNYKDLQAKIKSDKAAEELKKEDLKNRGMHDLLKKKQRKRRRRDPNDVAGFSSQGGRYREGVMLVRKADFDAVGGGK